MKKIILALALFLLPLTSQAAFVTVPQSTAYGQVLIGNTVGGNYTPVATSTLGISGGGSTITGTTGQTVFMQGTNSPIGTSTVFIGQNSGVSIGTTSTPYSFEVVGGSTSGTTRGDFAVDGANKAVYIGRLSGTSGDNTTFHFQDRTGVDRLLLQTGGSQDTIFKTNGSNFIVQNYGGTNDDLHITDAGLVGLSTSTPATLLDIFGVSPSIRIEDSVNNVGATNWGINTDQGNFYGALDFMTSSVQRGVPLTKTMEISSTSGVAIGASYAGTNLPPANGLIVQGKVGIGASVPTEPLTITESVSTNSGLIVSNGSGGDAALKIKNGNTGGREYDIFSTGSSDGSTGAGDFDIFDNSGGDSRFVINSNGFTGISTTSPSTNFSVQGNELISGTSTIGNVLATSTITISSIGTGCAQFTSGVLSSTGSACGSGGSSVGNPLNFVQASPNNYLIPTTTTTGFLITASSTIGNGLGNGGLTVSGQATTTGNAYFASNVLIGTTTPTNTLTVDGVNPNVGFYASTNGRALVFTPSLGSIDSIGAALQMNRSDAQTVAIGFSSASHFRVGQQIEATFGQTALVYIGNTETALPNLVIDKATGQTADLLDIRSASSTSGADLFNVRASGNVGISSTSPSTSFSVQGSSLISGTSTAGNFLATSTITIPNLGIAAGQFAAYDPTGKLIGTTTPAATITSGTSQPVKYATTGALPSNTYSGGVITEVGTGALSVDGASPAVADRVLVKNEGTAANNGIYTVTAAGSGIAAFVLTRATDYNSSSNIYPGIATYVISGSTLADDWWAMTSAAPITVGTTALNYTESSGGVLSAGTGITISGTTVSVNQAFTPTWSGLHTFTGGILGNNATSTITNLVMVNATSTNSTSTNEYISGSASTTAMRANTATIGALTVNSCTGCGGGSSPTVVTAFPVPNYGVTGTGVGVTYSSNTTGYLAEYSMPYGITTNKLTFNINSVTTSGVLKLGLYSENGQTQMFNVTSGTITTGGNQTLTVSSVSTTPGNYWLVVVPVGTANITGISWQTGGNTGDILGHGITGKPVLQGTISVTAGTLPTTFTPSAVSYNGDFGTVFRLDN